MTYIMCHNFYHINLINLIRTNCMHKYCIFTTVDGSEKWNSWFWECNFENNWARFIQQSLYIEVSDSKIFPGYSNLYTLKYLIFFQDVLLLWHTVMAYHLTLLDIYQSHQYRVTTYTYALSFWFCNITLVLNLIL